MAGMRKTPHTSKPNTPAAAPRDFRQEVTDRIIQLLEKGVSPWQKPWDATGLALMPINHVSKKPYRGGNALHLMITAMDRGYDDPRWMTYRQAADNKGQVQEGREGDADRVLGDQAHCWQGRADHDRASQPRRRHRRQRRASALQVHSPHLHGIQRCADRRHSADGAAAAPAL